MKQIVYVIVVFVLIGMSGVVHAQTSDVLPDPEEIFVDGVEWLLIEPEVRRIAQVDYEAHLIRLFDGDMRREFPYPPNVERVNGAALRLDGMIMVTSGSVDFDFRQTNNALSPENVWLLDPETGNYERPATVCEGRVLQALPGEVGKWTVAYRDDTYEEAFLCHSQTGEMRDVFPDGLTEYKIFPSPDAVDLVITGRIRNLPSDFLVFAYNLEADQLTSLGQISRDYDKVVEVCGWVSATKGILCSGDIYRSWPGTTYYTFDVTVPDSLVSAFGGWSNNILQIDDPPRYISLYSQNYSASITGGRGPNHMPCALKVVDAEQTLALEVGYECLPVSLNTSNQSPYYHQGDFIYFLTVDSEDATVSTLQSYNIRTLRHNQTLFTGEIETILSASPDGRYIVLIMDDSRSLDFSWRTTGEVCCFESEGHQVAILDSVHGNLVYRSEPIGVYTTKQVVWLADHIVVIAAVSGRDAIRISEANDVIFLGISPSLRRITFHDDFSVEAMTNTRYGLDRYTEPALNTSPDNRYWLMADHKVLDLSDFQPISLLRDGIEERYSIQMKWLERSELEVSVSNSVSTERYRVTIA